MMVVALKQVVHLDPTVLEVADLPPGWMATRLPGSGSWKRMKIPAG